MAANCARLLEAIPAQYPDYPVLQFLAGKSSWRGLVDRATASRNLRCNAHHWIALCCRAQGDRKTAGEHFAQSVETGTHWVPGFQWSRAFLARLEADPHWPPWIPARPSR